MGRSENSIGLSGINFTVSCFSCMRNGMTTVTDPDGITYDFTHTGARTISASVNQRVVSTWDSSVINAGDEVLRWGSLIADFTETSGNYVSLFFRSGDSSDLDDATWTGPYTMASVDLSGVSPGRYAQLRIVMVTQGTTPPTPPAVQSLTLSVYVADSSAVFMTKKSSIGFKAEYIMLTYNGTIDDAMIVQFAVSGKESDDFSSYSIIEPNKIVRLDSISPLADSIKIGIRGSGSSTSTFVIDEFAIVFSSKDGESTVVTPT